MRGKNQGLVRGGGGGEAIENKGLWIRVNKERGNDGKYLRESAVSKGKWAE